MITNKDLKDFNISLQKLEEQDLKLTVLFSLKYPDYKEFVKFKPSLRKEKIASDLRSKYIALLKKVDHPGVRIGSKKLPFGYQSKMTYSKLKNLECGDLTKEITIEEIEGIEKIKRPAKKFFISVKVRIAIQVEGIQTGKQLYEERIVIVKAKSIKKAEEKVIKGLKKESIPYLNSDGRLVTWSYEKTLDVYETSIKKSKYFNNDVGVEVFSALKRRKPKKK